MNRTPLARVVPFLLIALFGVISFGSTLRVGFMWDDHEMIEANPAIQSVSGANIAKAFAGDVFNGKGDPYFRPLQTLFNMADHAVWGLRPFGFHLTNLLLHLLTACLLLVCLRKILEDEVVALIVSIFFVIHPIIVEQLLIIAGRAEIMATLFTLAGLAVAFSPSIGLFALSVFFYALACLSKESGVLLPLLIPLAGWYNPKLRVPLWRYISYGLVLCLYLAVRAHAVGSAPLFGSGVGSFLLFSVHDLPTIFVRYIRILLFPIDLHSHRRMLFHPLWIWISPLLLLSFVATAAVRRWKVGVFAAVWFVIGLAPKVPLLAVNSLMLDHWAYLSGVGIYLPLSLFVVWCWNRSSRAAVVGSALLIVMASFWIGIARWNIKQRDTDFKMYTWALRFPTSSIVRFNLGLLYYQQRQYEPALQLFREALSMRPDFDLAANGEALCLWKLGKSDEALRLLNEWIAKRPGFAPSYANRDLISKAR